ncbi:MULTISPECIES: TolC family protein [Niastella]|uniref:TolC family protein n=1 Tax=Niastella soli TaxID=2821487 RepID=A0ABS3YTD9_9BACT|nr:TolC family protein [Niastella soli]MBO9201140.1 TolC family protein [Niastella soli]
MIKHCLRITVLLLAIEVEAQDNNRLTLEQAYDLARQNYPLIKQKDLVRQTATLTIENLNKGFLPQFTVSGQATVQSDVTRVGVNIPGIKFDVPGKDQYKVQAELSQMLFDGGNITAQKSVQTANELVEDQKAEVELYKVKDRINQLYLGILLVDEQVKQVDYVKSDIQLGVKRVEAQVKNGTAFRSSQLTLEAELLKNDQRVIELKANRKSLVDVLSLFINRQLPENVQLEQPVIPATLVKESVVRPELKLYSYQNELLKEQNQLISAKNRPRTSLFVQGGYGRPALNMLNNNFDWFYVAGVRFNWGLGNFYTSKKERELLQVNQRMVNIQQELFMLTTNTQLKQQEAEVNKLSQLIQSDQQIIGIRAQVKEAANAQLANGVITANDFLKEVNAEDQAKQTLITHQLQLLMAQVNARTITGNQ